MFRSDGGHATTTTRLGGQPGQASIDMSPWGKPRAARGRPPGRSARSTTCGARIPGGSERPTYGRSVREGSRIDVSAMATAANRIRLRSGSSADPHVIVASRARDLTSADIGNLILGTEAGRHAEVPIGISRPRKTRTRGQRGTRLVRRDEFALGWAIRPSATTRVIPSQEATFLGGSEKDLSGIAVVSAQL